MPELVRVGDMPGFDRALAEQYAQFSHCQYDWHLACEVLLPVPRGIVMDKVVTDLAMLIMLQRGYRPRLQLLRGGAR